MDPDHQKRRQTVLLIQVGVKDYKTLLLLGEW